MIKAQVQTQIFVYIMALVVGAGILIYGYNAVTSFKGQADDVTSIEFETTLKNDMKSISFESSKLKTYNLPSSVTEVCFKSYTAKSSDYIYVENKPLIADAIKQGTEDNVFIFPKGEKKLYTGTNIALDKQGLVKFKCFEVSSGILKIRITGQGTSVLITE